MSQKIESLGMYRDVMRAYPHPRSAEYITGLAAMRGGLDLRLPVDLPA